MNQTNNNSTLNAEQFEQLQTMYVDAIVDNMSMKELYAYVHDNVTDFCNKLTEKELIREIEYTMSEEELQEFITTIKEDSQG